MTGIRVSLGIVFYNPTQTDIARVNKYATCNLFAGIYVYDNSSSSHQKKLSPLVHYIHCAKNQGLSIPYNRMIEQSIENGSDYLCLLDQDSDFPLKEIKKIVEAIEKHNEGLTNTAIIAPRIYTRASIKNRNLPRPVFTTVSMAINSGSFLNMNYIKKHQLRYDENIFLDGVDYDFCWTISEKKCEVKIYEGSTFVQNLGYEIAKHPTFNAHSSIRYYYIAHNRKYVYRKHFGWRRGTYKMMRRNLSTFIRILRYEENRLSKAIALLRGWLG